MSASWSDFQEGCNESAARRIMRRNDEACKGGKSEEDVRGEVRRGGPVGRVKTSFLRGGEEGAVATLAPMRSPPFPIMLWKSGLFFERNEMGLSLKGRGSVAGPAGRGSE